MPSAKPWPGVEMNVIALAWVAMMLRPMVGQRSDSPRT
jgi:hypothetical protein